MKYSLFLSAAVALLLNYTPFFDSNSEEISPKMEKINNNDLANDELLRHVVLIKFKESSSEEDISEVEEAFSSLQDKIPEIKDYEWGTNNSPEGLDKGFTHCFLVTFESEEDRSTYLPHPEHKAFVEILEPHLEDVLVIDYWAGED